MIHQAEYTNPRTGRVMKLNISEELAKRVKQKEDLQAVADALASRPVPVIKAPE